MLQELQEQEQQQQQQKEQKQEQETEQEQEQQQQQQCVVRWLQSCGMTRTSHCALHLRAPAHTRRAHEQHQRSHYYT